MKAAAAAARGACNTSRISAWHLALIFARSTPPVLNAKQPSARKEYRPFGACDIGYRDVKVLRGLDGGKCSRSVSAIRSASISAKSARVSIEQQCFAFNAYGQCEKVPSAPRDNAPSTEHVRAARLQKSFRTSTNTIPRCHCDVAAIHCDSHAVHKSQDLLTHGTQWRH